MDSYHHMRSVLLKTYSMGSNFWKYPLCENTEFLNAVKNLTEIEN